MSQPSENQFTPVECQADVSRSVSFLIDPKGKDLGGFQVSRMLPNRQVRSVGPFVFLDHMGPADFAPGEGIEVRPHPHIGLATITYLFEGEILHRDSLGYVQAIRPGAVNLMIAGRGIVHSERTGPKLKVSVQRLNGLQMWLALPEDSEEIDPAFYHYAADELPRFSGEGFSGRLLVGQAFGLESPVRQISPTLYLEASMQRGAHFSLPDAEEVALYLLKGRVKAGDCQIANGQLAILNRSQLDGVLAESDASIALFGGHPLGIRHMYWNLVSSRPERIEQAKDDWREGRFDPVPGDDEFIPLPGEE